MKTLCVLLIVCLQVVIPNLYGATATEPQRKMHALIMCTTEIEDARASHKADSVLMQANLKTIAAQTNMQLFLTVLEDSQVTFDNLNNWAAGIGRAYTNDVVFIYYTGDRVNGVDAQKSPWPLVKVDGRSLSRSWLQTVILADVHPRFLVVLFDSYNTMKTVGYQEKLLNDTLKLHSQNPDQKDLGKIFGVFQKDYVLDFQKPLNPKTPMPGFDFLFSKGQGSLFIASSAAGKPAYGVRQDNNQSGFLTLAFCRSLARANSTPYFWQSLVGHMRPYLKYAIVEQNIFRVLKVSSQDCYADFSDLDHPNFPGRRMS